MNRVISGVTKLFFLSLFSVNALAWAPPTLSIRSFADPDGQSITEYRYPHILSDNVVLEGLRNLQRRQDTERIQNFRQWNLLNAEDERSRLAKWPTDSGQHYTSIDRDGGSQVLFRQERNSFVEGQTTRFSIINLDTGRTRRTFTEPGHRSVLSSRFSPDGRWVAVILMPGPENLPGRLVVFDLENGRRVSLSEGIIPTISGNYGFLHCAYTEDSEELIILDPRRLTVWDLKKNEFRQTEHSLVAIAQRVGGHYHTLQTGLQHVQSWIAASKSANKIMIWSEVGAFRLTEFEWASLELLPLRQRNNNTLFGPQTSVGWVPAIQSLAFVNRVEGEGEHPLFDIRWNHEGTRRQFRTLLQSDRVTTQPLLGTFHMTPSFGRLIVSMEGAFGVVDLPASTRRSLLELDELAPVPASESIPSQQFWRSVTSDPAPSFEAVQTAWFNTGINQVNFIRERVIFNDETQQQARTWVDNLGHDRFNLRNEAHAGLIRLALRNPHFIKNLLTGVAIGGERARRAEQIRETLPQLFILHRRLISLLKNSHTAEARRLVEDMAN